MSRSYVTGIFVFRRTRNNHKQNRWNWNCLSCNNDTKPII